MTNQNKVIFICGLHKSGTSILHEVLKDSPQISGFEKTNVFKDEGQHLQTVYPPAWKFGGLGKFGFDTAAYLDEKSALVTPQNKTKLWNEWSKHWDLSKPFLIEKSPPNLIRMKFLQTMFPQTHFIVIMRHPIAVTLATKPWSKTSIGNLLEHWLICYHKFLEDRNQVKNITLFTYEELIQNPTKVLNDLSAFIGTDLSLKNNKLSNNNEKYFQEWEKTKGSILKGWNLKYLINKYEQKVNFFGYSLKDTTKYGTTESLSHLMYNMV